MSYAIPLIHTREDEVKETLRNVNIGKIQIEIITGKQGSIKN